MSTIDRPDRRVLPPLVAGEHLDRATFHERCEAMPPGTRAELIRGSVSMPSPLYSPHAKATGILMSFLVDYWQSTPGVEAFDNITTLLGDDSEVRPDCILRVVDGFGGGSRLDSAGRLCGSPELVIEVAESSRTTDLGAKKDVYETAGVREYAVVALDLREVFWFALREHGYERISPKADGISKSEVFPGLWLDAHALFDGNPRQVKATAEGGLKCPEHAEFVVGLAAAGRREPDATG
jgi:Uma2 family endonuclease